MKYLLHSIVRELEYPYFPGLLAPYLGVAALTILVLVVLESSVRQAPRSHFTVTLFVHVNVNISQQLWKQYVYSIGHCLR